MTLSVQEAQTIIEKQTLQEQARGTPAQKIHDYLKHIHGAANIAKVIAQRIPGMNPDQIYVATLLHDFGRLEEARTGHFHGFIGYHKLKDQDEFAARTALIHMFPMNKIPPLEKCQDLFSGENGEEEYRFVANYTRTTQNEPWPVQEKDWLVQLADCLANKDGYVTLKERFEEYQRRHQVKLSIGLVLPRYLLKAHFDQRLGQNVYDLCQNLASPKTEPSRNLPAVLLSKKQAEIGG